MLKRNVLYLGRTTHDNADHMDSAYITAGGLPADTPRFRAGGEHRGSRHRALGTTFISVKR